MTAPLVLTDVDARGVATVNINRPQVNNAYNAEMILELLDTFGSLAENERVRLVLIRGKRTALPGRRRSEMDPFLP